MTADADTVNALQREGVLGRQWLRHHFTFFGNAEGAKLVGNELTERGFDVVVDEDVAGDTHWHVAAFRVERLDADELTGTRMELTSLATAHGGDYTGWDVARLGDGTMPDPTKPIS
ncbi:MAG TPA: ribonuclease E inhibitor RraB [Microbacterium sp.]|nr:ribonuclease E inhibitor RraB [Microbacterium sp.]